MTTVLALLLVAAPAFRLVDTVGEPVRGATSGSPFTRGGTTERRFHRRDKTTGGSQKRLL